MLFPCLSMMARYPSELLRMAISRESSQRSNSSVVAGRQIRVVELRLGVVFGIIAA